MIRIPHNLSRALTMISAVVCVALAFLWPNWRDDLRGQSYYYTYTVTATAPVLSGSSATFTATGLLATTIAAVSGNNTFSAGTLNGQNGWVVSPTPSLTVVETSVVQSGTQAVEVQPSTFSLSGASLFAPFATQLAGQIVTFSIDANFSATGTPSFWTVLDTQYNSSPPNIDFNIDQSGQIHIFIMGTDHPTGVSITRGVWKHYELVVNFLNDTVSAFYDGAPVLQGASFSSTGTTLNFVAFYSQAGALAGTDQAFFDNLSVTTSVPPGAIIYQTGFEPPQSAAGTALANPFIVKVTDAGSNPVPGVPVTFLVTAGNGTLTATTVVTNAQGLASSLLTLGATPGSNIVTATATGLSGSPVTFTATGL